MHKQISNMKNCEVVEEIPVISDQSIIVQTMVMN